MLSRHQYLLIIAILIIIPIILIIGVIHPASTKIHANCEEIDRQYEKFKTLLDKGQGLEKTKNNYDLIAASITDTDSVFLKLGSELNFITDLEQIAAAHDLDQNIIFDNKQISEENGLEKIPANISLNGSYQNIMAYLNELENLNYYINIHSLEISTTDQTAKKSPKLIPVDDNNPELPISPTINLKLSAITYWQ